MSLLLLYRQQSQNFRITPGFFYAQGNEIIIALSAIARKSQNHPQFGVLQGIISLLLYTQQSENFRVAHRFIVLQGMSLLLLYRQQSQNLRITPGFLMLKEMRLLLLYPQQPRNLRITHRFGVLQGMRLYSFIRNNQKISEPPLDLECYRE